MRYNPRPFWLVILSLVVFCFLFTMNANAQFYQKSYALVIGINQYQYPSLKRKNLNYARKDAESMATLLRSQGFEVISLYDAQAIKTTIITKMQNYLAPRVKTGDRVLVFFAGHGHTETLGGKDWGYIIPYDGGNESATYISMEELQTQSEKMGYATHQLFIMDACYGGLLGTKGGGVDPALPNYLSEIIRRVARQILTAGGKDQQVLDDGPGGHSIFTGVLLEALREDLADLNGDGYITFTELCSYVVPRASNNFQTPASSFLPGHGLGEFVFRASRKPSQPLPKPVEPTITDRRGATDTARSENTTLVPSTLLSHRYTLRSVPESNLSEDAVKAMLAQKNFYDTIWNANGQGLENQYEQQTINNAKVVVDNATGLMWQQSGSPNYMTYVQAPDYINLLNAVRFAGYSDWRLPTLEEAMSLLEPIRKNGHLYIDAVFDRTQQWIWTADKDRAVRVWFVFFSNGSCYRHDIFDIPYYVRAVRRG